MTIIGIGSTATAAVKFCKTASALFFGVNITAFEFVHDVRTHNAFVHVAHQELLVADELMAGIKIAPWCYRQILCTRAAAGKALCHTRAAA